MNNFMRVLAIPIILILLIVGCAETPSLSDGFGLYDSLVYINEVNPEEEKVVLLTIVNGKDLDRLFTISVNSPSEVKEGFEPFPVEYFYWIIIPETEVFVLAGESHQIPITLSMPIDIIYQDKKMEVRILVEDITQGGLHTALEARWFITTEG